MLMDNIKMFYDAGNPKTILPTCSNSRSWTIGMDIQNLGPVYNMKILIPGLNFVL